MVTTMPKRIHRKRPKTKRRFKAPRFLRVLLVLVVIAVGLYLGWLVARKISKPYVISYTESTEIASIQKQIADAKTENSQLKRDLEYLATPQGKEAEARRLGWVKKGETALVVQQPAQPQFQGEQSEAMKESFWQSVCRSVVKVFVKANGR